jgi:hypothetical protein
MTKTDPTREEWLTAAIEELRTEVFGPHDLEIPAYRVSVGWPGGRGKKSNTVGQCWNTAQTKDGSAAIFVSPVVDEPIEVLSILVHEVIHAIDDCASGHRGAFVQMFRRVGMTGKATQSQAGDELLLTLTKVERSLGEYPHSGMKRDAGGAGQKKQDTRMLKLVVADCDECEYSVRTTRKHIEVGLPKCPHGVEMVEV